MKKTVILILMLALTLSLCACGGPSAKDVLAGSPEPAETSAPAESQENTLPKGTVTVTADSARYENAWLGLACGLNEDWYIYSEEEMAQTAGLTAEQYEGTAYEEMLKKSDMFYDFFAARTDGTANISVNFSYTGTVISVDMDKYLEMLIPQLKSAVEAGGMSDVTITKNTVTFAGSERTGLLLHAKTQGMDYYAQQLYFFVGPRVATLNLGTFLEDNTAELLELFEALG